MKLTQPGVEDTGGFTGIWVRHHRSTHQLQGQAFRGAEARVGKKSTNLDGQTLSTRLPGPASGPICLATTSNYELVVLKFLL